MENQTPQTPEPQSTVVSEQNTVSAPAPITEHRSPNTFLVVLLSILLLISVSVAGFFAYQTQNLVKELYEITSYISTPAPTQMPVATTDPTANWTTYTNDKIGFSIQYPANWKKLELETGVKFGPVEIGEDYIMGVNYYEKSTNPLSSIINEVGKQFPDRKVLEETILVKPENIQAQKFIVTTPTIPDWYAVIILYTTSTHYIVVGNGAMRDSDLPFNRGVPIDFTFEKFYSTFKFTN